MAYANKFQGMFVPAPPIIGDFTVMNVNSGNGSDSAGTYMQTLEAAYAKMTDVASVCLTSKYIDKVENLSTLRCSASLVHANTIESSNYVYAPNMSCTTFTVHGITASTLFVLSTSTGSIAANSVQTTDIAFRSCNASILNGIACNSSVQNCSLLNSSNAIITVCSCPTLYASNTYIDNDNVTLLRCSTGNFQLCQCALLTSTQINSTFVSGDTVQCNTTLLAPTCQITSGNMTSCSTTHFNAHDASVSILNASNATILNLSSLSACIQSINVCHAEIYDANIYTVTYVTQNNTTQELMNASISNCCILNASIVHVKLQDGYVISFSMTNACAQIMSIKTGNVSLLNVSLINASNMNGSTCTCSLLNVSSASINTASVSLLNVSTMNNVYSNTSILSCSSCTCTVSSACFLTASTLNTCACTCSFANISFCTSVSFSASQGTIVSLSTSTLSSSTLNASVGTFLNTCCMNVCTVSLTTSFLSTSVLNVSYGVAYNVSFLKCNVSLLTCSLANVSWMNCSAISTSTCNAVHVTTSLLSASTVTCSFINGVNTSIISILVNIRSDIQDQIDTVIANSSILPNVSFGNARIMNASMNTLNASTFTASYACISMINGCHAQYTKVSTSGLYCTGTASLLNASIMDMNCSTVSFVNTSTQNLTVASNASMRNVYAWLLNTSFVYGTNTCFINSSIVTLCASTISVSTLNCSKVSVSFISVSTLNVSYLNGLSDTLLSYLSNINNDVQGTIDGLLNILYTMNQNANDLNANTAAITSIQCTDLVVGGNASCVLLNTSITNSDTSVLTDIYSTAIQNSSIVYTPLLRCDMSACFNNASVYNLTCTGTGRFVHDIVTGYSDDRLKTRTSYLQDCLPIVSSWNTFKYVPRQDNEYNLAPQEQIGLSAQEVQKSFPQVVQPSPIDQNYLTIMYDRLIPVLVRCISELNTKIENIDHYIRSYNTQRIYGM